MSNFLTMEIPSLETVRRAVSGASERRIRAAAATAMTWSAVKARDALKDGLQRSLDRPTPYTVRAIKYVGATADRLVAAVGFNVAGIEDIHGNVVRYEDLGTDGTPAGRYLRWQVEGGHRSQKRFEKALQKVRVLPDGWRAVPGERAKLDAYGNQSVGELRQILSWFDAAELVAGSRQNMMASGREKRRKGTRKRAGFEYFVVVPGAVREFRRANGRRGTHRLPPGIYRRTALAMGNRVEPVVIFVRSASYKPRFDFYGIAGQSISQTLQPGFYKALAASLARARR